LTDGTTVLARTEFGGDPLDGEALYCAGEAVFEGLAAVAYTAQYTVVSSSGHNMYQYNDLASA